MADIFISYAREDRARAEQVARGLEAMGLKTFWDTEIPPGQTWADYIESKLNNCRSVIVLWSEHSTKSQWVREEARMGRDKSKLIPVMLDGSPMPFGFGEVQAADLSTWRGDANHDGWRRLSRAAYAAVNGSETPTPPPAAALQAPQPPPQHVYAAPPVSMAAAPSSGGNSPVDYIRKCFRLYADGKGRARRGEYGWFVLFAYVVMFVAAVIDGMASGTNPYTSTANDNYVFMIIVGLALTCPVIAVASRRAHDFGQSGWLAVLTAIPYIGLVATLVFVFVPGQPADNQYGPNPKAS